MKKFIFILPIISTFLNKSNNTITTRSFDDTVNVGILHSLSGCMAISESTLVDAEIMAIEEINSAGGVSVGGKSYKINYIVEDGASDSSTFTKKSNKLIDKYNCQIIFGGSPCASRPNMVPESKKCLLYYPFHCEGICPTHNIFYTGSTPNQQVMMGTNFMYHKSKAAGGDFYLVGSDAVLSHVSNSWTKDQVKQLGGKVVGEDYLPLGRPEVAPIISKMIQALPEGGIIINTLNGDQNVAFFKQIQDAGITPSNGYYVMNYVIAEEEIATIGPEFLEGHYGCHNYMMSINTPASKKFVTNFRNRWGCDRVVGSPQESAYNMVYLWKQAVEDAGTFDDNAVREALVGQKFDAPQGPIEVMPNHHLTQTVRIGEINSEGNYDIREKFEKSAALKNFAPGEFLDNYPFNSEDNSLNGDSFTKNHH